MATMAQAIRMALHYGEEHLGVTDIFGEDVGAAARRRLHRHAGPEDRVEHRRSTSAASSAWRWASRSPGQRPVAEIQFCDYIFNTIDLLKIAGNTCWASNGDWNLPMVVMTPVGTGIRGSIYHSHSFDAPATRIPGWKIVMPSNAARRLRADALAPARTRTR